MKPLSERGFTPAQFDGATGPDQIAEAQRMAREWKPKTGQ